jgi:hypothetical protein
MNVSREQGRSVPRLVPFPVHPFRAARVPRFGVQSAGVFRSICEHAKPCGIERGSARFAIVSKRIAMENPFDCKPWHTHCARK